VECSKSRARGKFIAFNVCIRKEERSKISNISFHLSKVEKAEQVNTKLRRK
jgi:hypothetical protein